MMNTVRKGSVRRRRVDAGGRKKATVLVWTACSLTTLVGFTALAVDVSYTLSVKAELQRTADAAAMAAASQLAGSDGDIAALVLAMADEFAQKNRAGGVDVAVTSDDVVLGRAVPDGDGYAFEPGVDPPDAVRITVRLSDDSPNGPIGLFFGPALGVDSANVTASATAMLVPRDIAVVIDLSNSMSYDSQLRHEDITAINIDQVWEDLGSPTFGNLTVFHNSAGEMPYISSSYSNDQIIRYLDLDEVPYPYPRGSWSEYVSYVKSMNYDWGYRHRYGLRTWVNYLLDRRPGLHETPDLQDTREQPTHAVKQAVEELCLYLTMMDTNDYMSVHYYSDNAWTGVTLTPNYNDIVLDVYAQHAGNEGRFTNIYAGMMEAIDELQSDRARPSAKKVIFILTDGNPNRPSGTNPSEMAMSAASTAEGQNIQVYTISLGAGANQSLMEDMADEGKGMHYHVPGTQISEYEEELREVFRTLGGKRPVRLIE